MTAVDGKWKPTAAKVRRAPRTIARLALSAVKAERRSRNVARAIRTAPASLPTVAAAPPVGAHRPALERLLRENIVPFWLERSIDPEGGYRLNHDEDGRWLGPTPKRAIAQARQAWFFARLARSPYGTQEHLAASRHGIEFLWERQRDEEFGGFFWEVELPDGEPTPMYKSVLTQAYVLYAFAEYGLASGDAEAIARASELFGLIEQKTRDRAHGGFVEFFTRDWKAPPRGVVSYHQRNDPTHKTFGTQVHMLEALVPYLRLSGDARGREALAELLGFIERRMIFRPVMIGSTIHKPDGTAIHRNRKTVLNYGHDVELAWLALDARSALGWPVDPVPDHVRGLFANAVVLGEDPSRGVARAGPIGGRPFDHRRTWWVQAEAMVAALWLYRLTGEQEFAAAFDRIIRWIVDHQADWTAGEWHHTVMPDGETSGVKAGPWKTGYHNGRAVLECLALLDELEQEQPS